MRTEMDSGIQSGSKEHEGFNGWIKINQKITETFFTTDVRAAAV